MASYLERAKELRAATDVHYNCAQSVVVPFAERAGYTTEEACAFAAAFGGGMQSGNLCGAFTGGLMALGVMGAASHKNVVAFTRQMKANHDGTLLCAELLRKNAQAGGEKKPHCDGMVFEAVQLVEQIVESQEQ